MQIKHGRSSCTSGEGELCGDGVYRVCIKNFQFRAYNRWMKRACHTRDSDNDGRTPKGFQLVWALAWLGDIIRTRRQPGARDIWVNANELILKIDVHLQRLARGLLRP
jgi:hypothetical protein